MICQGSESNYDHEWETESRSDKIIVYQPHNWESSSVTAAETNRDFSEDVREHETFKVKDI